VSTRSDLNDLIEVLLDWGGAPRLPKRSNLALGWREREAHDIAEEMRKLKRAAHRLAEAGCNGELTDYQTTLDERTDDRFRDLCAAIGAEAVISGDPRGCVYHVRFKGKGAPYNTWGGAEMGWGILR
jgi:hypothetical protein